HEGADEHRRGPDRAPSGQAGERKFRNRKPRHRYDRQASGLKKGAMQPDSRHVIITGGSSGIGAAIAQAYAQKGANISLIARTEAALVTKIRELETRFGQDGRRFRFQIAD